MTFSGVQSGSISPRAAFGQVHCPPIYGFAGFPPLSAGWQPTGVGQPVLQPPPSPEVFQSMMPPATPPSVWPPGAPHMQPGWLPVATPFVRPPAAPPPPPAFEWLQSTPAGNADVMTGTHVWQPPAELSIRPHSAEQDYSARLWAAKAGATSKAPSLAGPGMAAEAAGQAAEQNASLATPEMLPKSTKEPISSVKQELRKGITVRLHSLKTMALNGKVGVLEEIDGASGRWRVLVDGQLKSLKPENLSADHDVGGATARGRSRSRSPSTNLRNTH
eukprot:TRINITY_DN93137_c0_g1_i1.p1 TRINITY_DN93137_c0_g1~~TRINITY_DN93137_c0_g1_i1.p1  ORF type:complete len:275 (-),score=31.80 TRINITY_DN93137_c0_g1_i1:219-1043(-)